MDNQVLEAILSEMNTVFSENGFKRVSEDDVVFANDRLAVKIYYIEAKKLFKMDTAVLEEGKDVEFSNVSTWLYDNGHTLKDAHSIGRDFAVTVEEQLGIKKSIRKSARDVALPSKGQPGSTPGIEAFCGRFLTLFPQYKDEYKENVAKYGEFLYEDFFGRCGADKFLEIAEKGDKKAIGKMLNLLDEFYVDGDYTVQSTITYSIIGGAFFDKPELFDDLAEKYADSMAHIIEPGKLMIKNIAKKEKRTRA